ncbi:hypothetical protein ACIHDR_03060 [Nocardia sp. NPDC052278]|uniref:hypothetical protein n=1 Tax=unclassified Nocardia TaxID=2637762 RepID=UPI0036B391D4
MARADLVSAKDRRAGDIDSLAVEEREKVSLTPWLVVVLVLIALLCAGFVAIVLLAKVLSAPEREIAIRIRMMPWPRIVIEPRR